MFKLSVLGGAVALMALPIAAQAEPVKSAGAKSDGNKIVCKKEEQIGSRLAAKKVCMTVEEWRRVADLNREETERAQLNARAPAAN